MSLDYWHLSIATVQLALRSHGYENKPSGTAEFKFRVGKDWYYVYCGQLPRLYIQRFVDVADYLGDYTSEQLLSVFQSVNSRLSLVKVCMEDVHVVRFTLCLHEDRYLVFKEKLVEYIRELDDAVESFRMAAILLREEEKEELMKDYIDRMMNAEDDMYKVKRLQS